MVDLEERLVRSLSRTYAGRVHEKRIGDAEDSPFPPCGLFQETGFQGFEPDHVCT